MTQPGLFDAPAEPPAPPPAPVSRYEAVRPDHDEQAEQLARVGRNIAGHILDFCRSRVYRPFRLEALTNYVTVATGCAPGSPDRILRDLRDRKMLDYEAERPTSTYTVRWVVGSNDALDGRKRRGQ